jgi:hypothetical protein
MDEIYELGNNICQIGNFLWVRNVKKPLSLWCF